MLIFLGIFTSSFIIALSGAMMPGPLLTATISESSRRGFIAGPLLILGHGILELALVVALILGLAPFLMQQEVFIGTALVGAVILGRMAYGMLRSLPDLHLPREQDNTARRHLVMTGALLSITNPYWTIWWVSFGLGYILYCLQFGVWGIIFFFSGHILADLAWHTMVSAAVEKGRGFLNDRVYRRVIGTCAVFLLVFAGYFAYTGLHRALS